MRIYIGIEFARGVAALMVLVCHYAYMVTNERTFLNFLWTGVDVFFVISGFVFARLILSSQINLASFFIRRLFRIYPLYFVVLIIYFFLTAEHTEKINYLINHIFFLQTMSSKEEAFYFNPAFWSLPVEVEFYMFVPILAYLMKFKNSLIIITVFSLICKLFLVIQSTPDTLDIYGKLGVHLTGILPEFLIGIFLYKFVILTNSYRKTIKMKLNIIATLLGSVFIFFLSVYFIKYGDLGFKEDKLLGGWYTFLCAFSYALILFPLSSINEVNISKHLNRFLIFIGSISYPVYLIHNASPKFFQSIGININGINLFIACILLTICISIILHKYIEEPSRLYGRALSNSQKPPVA